MAEKVAQEIILRGPEHACPTTALESHCIAFVSEGDYRKVMSDLKLDDLFVSTEEEVEVDEETAAAIEIGIKQADEGLLVPSEEVHRRVREWLARSSTQKPL